MVYENDNKVEYRKVNISPPNNNNDIRDHRAIDRSESIRRAEEML